MRTLPANYDTLTLDEIDAAIATFCDPLTADEVVALAQWWTVRSIRMAMINLVPKEELALIAGLGDWRRAWTLASALADFRERFEVYLAIYCATPHKPDTLTALFFEQLELLTPHRRMNLFAADDLLDVLYRQERHEMAYMFIRLRNSGPRPQELIPLIRSYVQAGDPQQAMAAVEVLFALFTMKALDKVHALSEAVSYLATLGDVAVAGRWLTRLKLEHEHFVHELALEEPVDYPGSPSVEYKEKKTATSILYLLNGYVALEDWRQVHHWLEAYLALRAVDMPQFLVETFARSISRATDVPMLAALGSLIVNRISNLQLFPVRRLIELQAVAQARNLLSEIEVVVENCADLISLYHQVGWRAKTLTMLRKLVANFDPPPSSNRYYRSKRLIANLFSQQHITEALRLVEETLILDPYQLRELMANALTDQPTAETIALVLRWLEEPIPATPNVEAWHVTHIRLLLKCFQYDRDATRSRRWYDEAVVRLGMVSDIEKLDELYRALAEVLMQKGDMAAAFSWLAQLKAWRKHPNMGYDFGQRALEQKDKASAAAYLKLAQQHRPLFPPRIFLEIAEFIKDKWHELQLTYTPDVPAANPVDMRQPASMVDLWQSHPALFVYPFLQRLPDTQKKLEAHTPGLYPRVLKACLEIVSHFAPEWNELVQTLDEMR